MADATLKLDDVYSPHQVKVRSTNQNMTLMGSEAQLEAIFPPGVRKELTPEQAKRAVPPGNNEIIKEDIAQLGNKVMPNQF